jgi:hypothetical protein
VKGRAVPSGLSLADEFFLLHLALLAIEFAGFIGVVAAVHRPEAGWALRDVAGIKLILEFTLAEVFFALLPLLLASSLGAVGLTWRLPGLLLAGFLAAEMAVQARRALLLARRGEPPRALPAVLALFFPGTAAIALAELVNVLTAGSQAVYRWGLAWLLVGPALQVFTFVSAYAVPAERRALDDGGSAGRPRRARVSGTGHRPSSRRGCAGWPRRRAARPRGR